MAIDTENKRRSVQNYTIGGAMRPEADGGVDVADRPVVANMYAGHTYEEPPEETDFDAPRGLGLGFGVSD